MPKYAKLYIYGSNHQVENYNSVEPNSDRSDPYKEIIMLTIRKKSK